MCGFKCYSVVICVIAVNSFVLNFITLMSVWVGHFRVLRVGFLGGFWVVGFAIWWFLWVFRGVVSCDLRFSRSDLHG